MVLTIKFWSNIWILSSFAAFASRLDYPWEAAWVSRKFSFAFVVTEYVSLRDIEEHDRLAAEDKTKLIDASER
jgi:hypothetical protein